MEIHNEILNNINKRFVLLKREKTFLIVDKTRGTIVIIDDPLINKGRLISLMKKKKVEIYNSIQELPIPTEKALKIKEFPKKFQIFVKKIYNNEGNETGAIISALTNYRVESIEKNRIENIIKNYAFDKLYPNEGLNFYSEMNNDTASMIVIKGINNLPTLDKNLYDW